MTLKHRLARLLSVFAASPPAARALRASAHYAEVLVQLAATRALHRRLPPPPYEVMHGPFAGMKYTQLDSHAGAWPMEMFGTYEAELHTVIEEICGSTYEHVLNIGAGDGYYTVGLARRLPSARLIAFEMSPESRALCLARANANGVHDRIEIHGACTAAGLAAALRDRSGLIVCDCEGCEVTLLMPEQVPDLQRFDILVELHDHMSEGPTISQVMARRFARTHSVEFINMRPGRPIAGVAPRFRDSLEFRSLVAETGRGASVGWAWLRARVSPAGSGRVDSGARIA